MARQWGILILSYSFILFRSAHTVTQCNERELQECAEIGSPLSKDPNLMVPDSESSVFRVCRIWSKMTACIDEYTNECMNTKQKADFDKSFHDSATSIDTLCQDQKYRKEYLLNAPCIKETTTDEEYCGMQYKKLMERISEPTVNVKKLCCSRLEFRQCVKKIRLPKTCRKNKEGNSTALILSTLDKSLAFIAQQCSSSRFESEQCTGQPKTPVKSRRENSKGPLIPESGDRGSDSDFNKGKKPSSISSTKKSNSLSNSAAKGKRPSKPSSSDSLDEKQTKAQMDEPPKTNKLSSSSGHDENSSSFSLHAMLHHGKTIWSLAAQIVALTYFIGTFLT